MVRNDIYYLIKIIIYCLSIFFVICQNNEPYAQFKFYIGTERNIPLNYFFLITIKHSQLVYLRNVLSFIAADL